MSDKTVVAQGRGKTWQGEQEAGRLQEGMDLVVTVCTRSYPLILQLPAPSLLGHALALGHALGHTWMQI